MKTASHAAQDPSGPGDEIHITSIVVRARPAAVDRLAEFIAGFPEAEVHAADPGGKLIVLLETRTLSLVTEYLDRIAQLPDVVTASLVFHQVEDLASLDTAVEARTSQTISHEQEGALK